MKYFVGLLCMFAPTYALSLEPQTLENLSVLEDKLEEHIADGYLSLDQIDPLTVVEVTSQTEDPKSLSNAVIKSLGQSLNAAILVCDACRPTYKQSEKETIINSGIIEIDDIKKAYQGSKTTPKAAVWVNADATSLSIRIVSIENSRVLFAETINPDVDWSSRSIQSFSRSRQAERKARGDAVLHGQFDLGILGQSHIGYNLMQQWGDSNQYLSGISVNLTDPLLGFGINTFKVFPEFNNMLMGGKFLISLPSAISSAVSKNSSSSDQSPYTLVAMVKYPILPDAPARFLVNAYISTNGAVGIGLTW